jgi:hypothetical protein
MKYLLQKSLSSVCFVHSNCYFGYYTTDTTLDNGSARLASVDSYYAPNTSPEEVAYNFMSTIDVQNIVYRAVV